MIKIMQIIRNMIYKSAMVLLSVLIMLMVLPIYDLSNKIHVMSYIAVLVLYTISCYVMVKGICNDK